jgi:nucleoside-diphosphate-sugar epimerase
LKRKKKGNTIMNKTLFITGATGFIGHETVVEGVKAGWQVKGLIHSDRNAEALRKLGAQAVVGDVHQPQSWIAEARGATALIDLVQPKFPRSLSRKAIKALSSERQGMTRSMLEALRSLPSDQRPLFISASGADDLQPDAQNTISHDSVLRSRPRGYASIGIPVRKLIEASRLDATYVYLGNLVYGPGKVFAEQFVEGLRQGTARIVGNGHNRLPLTQVTDAARALVHLAGLAQANANGEGMGMAALAETDVVGRTFIAADGSDATQRMLLEATADAMGVKRPGSAPAWLAALVAGAISVETITLDVHADNSALRETGFEFRYPSYREGVPATLQALGEGSVLVSAGASTEGHAHTSR